MSINGASEKMLCPICEEDGNEREMNLYSIDKKGVKVYWCPVHGCKYDENGKKVL